MINVYVFVFVLILDKGETGVIGLQGQKGDTVSTYEL